MKEELEGLTIPLYGDNKGFVKYINHLGTSKTVTNAARVSFGKQNDLPFGEKDAKLLRYLLKHHHSSPMEQISITFMCKVPLPIRSQHMRHRTGKYNEISRRYSGENIEFFNPHSFRTQHENNRQASNIEDLINPEIQLEKSEMFCGSNYLADDIFEFHSACSLEIYEKLLAAGVCREQARMVLPQNLYTTYYAQHDLSNLLKFLKLRTHEGSQAEMVELAKGMETIATACFPEIMQIWKELNP